MDISKLKKCEDETCWCKNPELKTPTFICADCGDHAIADGCMNLMCMNYWMKPSFTGC